MTSLWWWFVVVAVDDVTVVVVSYVFEDMEDCVCFC